MTLASAASRVAVAGLLVAAFSASLPAFADDAGDPVCRTVERPVSVTPGGTVTAEISGTLCTPVSWSGGERQIDVLVHGGSYNQTYWDWPQDPSTYSYVRRASADGRATFAYDRLGVGKSSRPLSALVTVQSDAYVLHQLVGWLRSSESHAPKGDRLSVNVVSHSIGGIVAIEEAAKYDDVDRLVVTGMLHGVGIGVAGIGTFVNYYPATLDPAFLGTTLDASYVTTLPGARGWSYYNTKTADPDVIAYDEAHKDVTTHATIVSTALADQLPAPLNSTSRVHAQVLSIVGQQDIMFCGVLLNCRSERAVRLNEAPYFSHAESFTAETVPDTGHNLALHPSSGTSYRMISDWIESH
jgi:pimeloyl-ACP methyl ester carboxylesterase